MKITLAQVKDGKQCIVATHPVFYPELVTPACINIMPGYVSNMIGYGFEEKRFGQKYNSYRIGDFVYRKNHLFPGYDDGRTRGHRLPHVYVGGMKTYVVICYDIRFPELFARMKKPDLVIIPSNWPTIRINDWCFLLKQRALENRCIIAGINATGLTNGFECGGMSMVVNSNGTILNEVDSKEKLIEVEI